MLQSAAMHRSGRPVAALRSEKGTAAASSVATEDLEIDVEQEHVVQQQVVQVPCNKHAQ